MHAQRTQHPASFCANLAVRFSDQQWSRIARLSGLPDQARKDLEGAFGLHQFARDRQANYRIALLTPKDRRKLRGGTLRLSKSMTTMFAPLMDRQLALQLDPSIEILLEKLAEFVRLLDGFKSPPPRVKNHLDRQFVIVVAFFLEKYTGRRISRTYKGDLPKLIKDICNVARLKIGSGTIDEALKDYISRVRGENGHLNSLQSHH